jgi:hypothetical protein
MTGDFMTEEQKIPTQDKIKVKPEPVHYVDNKAFYAAILERKALLKEAEENGTEPPKITNYLGDCIIRISVKLATKGNFSGYAYKSEMIGDAIENCMVYFDKFNPEKSTNPFSYYTQIIYFAFLRRIKKEKDQFHIKHKIIQSVGETVLALQQHDDAEYVNGFREFLKDFSNVVIPEPEKKVRKVREPVIPVIPPATLDFFLLDSYIDAA